MHIKFKCKVILPSWLDAVKILHGICLKKNCGMLLLEAYFFQIRQFCAGWCRVQKAMGGRYGRRRPIPADIC